MADSASAGRRRLGTASAAAIVVANMIGVGVFTTSGFALADLGARAPVLAAWALGGITAMCGALCYGALARRIPVSGGEYTFLKKTVHPAAGFLAGWISLLAGFTAPIAAAALGLGVYLAPYAGRDASAPLVASGAIVLAALLHGVRLGAGVIVQNVAVALKLALLAGFAVFAWLRSPPAATTAAAEAVGFDAGAFAVVLVWISFAYAGWNAAVYVAGEVRAPERNLPRALLLATGLVFGVYLALNAAFLFAAPASALAGRADVAAAASEALGGPRLSGAVSVLVALALFTSISSMVMIGPRVYAQMADDGLFPRLFRFEGQVPAAAVALQSLLALAVVWLAGLRELLGYIGFTLGLSSAASVAALLALRAREGAAAVPIPGYPWVPALYLGVTSWASAYMAWRAPEQAALGAATALSGLLLYRRVAR